MNNFVKQDLVLWIKPLINALNNFILNNNYPIIMGNNYRLKWVYIYLVQQTSCKSIGYDFVVKPYRQRNHNSTTCKVFSVLKILSVKIYFLKLNFLAIILIFFFHFYTQVVIVENL